MKRALTRSSRLVGLELALALALICATACTTSVRTEHYLAVYDPEAQITEALYRIEIEGHSPWTHEVRYGSGWVPAEYADLLTREVRLEEQGRIRLVGGADPARPRLRASRRLYEIGPLGISSQPADGRFTVVMSSDPDAFFRRIALLQDLGAVSRRGRLDQAQAPRLSAELQQRIAGERRRLRALELELLGQAAEARGTEAAR